jgi:hypothetical protein
VIEFFVAASFTVQSLPVWYATAVSLKQYALAEPHYSRSTVPLLLLL